MTKNFLVIDNRELRDFAKKFNNATENSKTAIKKTIEYVARQFLKDVKARTPKKTGNLRQHWDLDNADIVVKETKHTFTVYLVNKAEYAKWVENGHFSYNQFNVGGAPYTVKNRTVPYTYGTNAPTFVYGVFYLKKTEIDYNDMGKLDKLVSQRFNSLLWTKGSK